MSPTETEGRMMKAKTIDVMERKDSEGVRFPTCARAIEHARRELRASGGRIVVWGLDGRRIETIEVEREIYPVTICEGGQVNDRLASRDRKSRWRIRAVGYWRTRVERLGITDAGTTPPS